MSSITTNNPKTTVAALATGLESLSALIKDETLQRVCIIISPAIALAISFFYKNITHYINSKKGLREYSKMISEFELELNSPHCTHERKEFLKLEIQKCWININSIRTKNINIITE